MPGHDEESLIPLGDVQAMVLAGVSPLAPVAAPIDEALGCVTAEEVLVAEDVPPFANTAMDGYAVRAADTAAAPVELEVVGVLAAGAAPSVPVGPAQGVQIMTGAPIPDGADAIAIVERTEVLEMGTDGRTPLRVRVGYSVAPGENIRLAGSDLAIGSVAVEAGTVLTPGHLGVLASIGVVAVSVHRRPRVGVVTTGDELVEIGLTPVGELAPGQIRDSNRHALIASLRRDGFDVVDFGVVRDTEEEVSRAIVGALSGCDAVLTTGGVSKGEFDYVKVVLEQLVSEAGESARFEQLSVAMRPAKPFAFALLPRPAGGAGAGAGAAGAGAAGAGGGAGGAGSAGGEGAGGGAGSAGGEGAGGGAGSAGGEGAEPALVPVFGLPGNPVSSLVSYQVLALPVLRVLAGRPAGPAVPVVAVAVDGWRRRSDGKLHLDRAEVRWGPIGRLEARGVGGQMSHQLSGMALANALALVPDGDGVEPGDDVEVLVFGDIG